MLWMCFMKSGARQRRKKRSKMPGRRKPRFLLRILSDREMMHIRSLLGSLDRNTPSHVKSMRNLDIRKTIRKNLSHYDPEEKRLVLEQVYFSSRTRKYNQWRVVIAVDESGSMLDSVIHSAVMAGIFARLPMLDTRLVIFDTQVVDLSAHLDDPVETLMSIQLGGGTYITGALQYCEGLIENPNRTMVVLVSDLCEGGSVAGRLTPSRPAKIGRAHV